MTIPTADPPFTPLATALERLEAAVSPLVGIVTRTVSTTHTTDESPLPNCASELASARRTLGAATVDYGSGAHPLPPRARAAALGEAIERYSAMFVPHEALRVATARALGDAAVRPARFALFHETQHEQPAFPFARFDESTRTRWVEATALADGSPSHVPAELVYLRRPEPGVRPIGYSTSSGLACAPTLSEAVLAALLELVERDAVMLAWKCRLSLPLLDWSDDAALCATRHTFLRLDRAAIRRRRRELLPRRPGRDRRRPRRARVPRRARRRSGSGGRRRGGLAQGALRGVRGVSLARPASGHGTRPAPTGARRDRVVRRPHAVLREQRARGARCIPRRVSGPDTGRVCRPARRRLATGPDRRARVEAGEPRPVRLCHRRHLARRALPRVEGRACHLPGALRARCLAPRPLPRRYALSTLPQATRDCCLGRWGSTSSTLCPTHSREGARRTASDRSPARTSPRRGPRDERGSDGGLSRGVAHVPRDRRPARPRRRSPRAEPDDAGDRDALGQAPLSPAARSAALGELGAVTLAQALATRRSSRAFGAGASARSSWRRSSPPPTASPPRSPAPLSRCARPRPAARSIRSSSTSPANVSEASTPALPLRPAPPRLELLRARLADESVEPLSPYHEQLAASAVFVAVTAMFCPLAVQVRRTRVPVHAARGRAMSRRTCCSRSRRSGSPPSRSAVSTTATSIAFLGIDGLDEASLYLVPIGSRRRERPPWPGSQSGRPCRGRSARPAPDVTPLDPTVHPIGDSLVLGCSRRGPPHSSCSPAARVPAPVAVSPPAAPRAKHRPDRQVRAGGSALAGARARVPGRPARPLRCSRGQLAALRWCACRSPWPRRRGARRDRGRVRHRRISSPAGSTPQSPRTGPTTCSSAPPHSPKRTCPVSDTRHGARRF